MYVVMYHLAEDTAPAVCLAVKGTIHEAKDAAELHNKGPLNFEWVPERYEYLYEDDAAYAVWHNGADYVYTIQRVN